MFCFVLFCFYESCSLSNHNKNGCLVGCAFHPTLVNGSRWLVLDAPPRQVLALAQGSSGALVVDVFPVDGWVRDTGGYARSGRRDEGMGSFVLHHDGGRFSSHTARLPPLLTITRIDLSSRQLPLVFLETVFFRHAPVHSSSRWCSLPRALPSDC